MKKLSLVILMLLVCSTAFASGWVPGKCGSECKFLAYQQCVAQQAVFNPTKYPGYTRPDGIVVPARPGYDLDTKSTAFKTCETQQEADCKMTRGCR